MGEDWGRKGGRKGREGEEGEAAPNSTGLGRFPNVSQHTSVSGVSTMLLFFVCGECKNTLGRTSFVQRRLCWLWQGHGVVIIGGGTQGVEGGGGGR